MCARQECVPLVKLSNELKQSLRLFSVLSNRSISSIFSKRSELMVLLIQQWRINLLDIDNLSIFITQL